MGDWIANCRACGRLITKDKPRVEVVKGDVRHVWCGKCCSEASYSGQLWNNIQVAIFMLSKES